jgi:alpha/beta superfamily hydrolase
MGGSMHTKVVYQASKALARIGCAVVRFNFRGVGRSAGMWDEGRGEADDFGAALEFTRSRYPTLPLWVAGMSFGSWIALEAGVADARVTTLIGISMPTGRYDFGRIPEQHEAEVFHPRRTRRGLPAQGHSRVLRKGRRPKELVIIDAADHLFDGRVGEVADAIEELLEDWN